MPNFELNFVRSWQPSERSYFLDIWQRKSFLKTKQLQKYFVPSSFDLPAAFVAISKCFWTVAEVVIFVTWLVKQNEALQDNLRDCLQVTWCCSPVIYANRWIFINLWVFSSCFFISIFWIFLVVKLIRSFDAGILIFVMVFD